MTIIHSQYWQPKKQQSTMFNPKLHKSTPNVTTTIDKMDIPKIRVSKLALHKMYLYVKIADQEVGWMGSLLDNREKNGEFYLKDVFLAKQEVSAVTTHLTHDGVAEMMNELMAMNDAMEICNNLKFWGHSHVNMEVLPSHQDEATVEDLRGDTSDYFLRGIFNKGGEVKFTLFLYDSNIQIDDIDWYVENLVEDDLEKQIEIEFKEKVSKVSNVSFQHCQPMDQRIGEWSDINDTWQFINGRWVFSELSDNKTDSNITNSNIIDEFDVDDFTDEELEAIALNDDEFLLFLDIKYGSKELIADGVKKLLALRINQQASTTYNKPRNQ